jgi:hypothetical protein
MVTRKKIVLGCTTVLLSSCVTEYEFSSQSYSFGQAVVSGNFGSKVKILKEVMTFPLKYQAMRFAEEPPAKKSGSDLLFKTKRY